MLKNPPPLEVTPEKHLEFEKWLLEQVVFVVQETSLPRFHPNSQWVLTIENGRVQMKLRREEFILKA